MGVSANGVRAAMRNRRGQATVEMAIAFPVLIVVAVIAVNVTLFFSECAAFDRAFRQETRAIAASPAYAQGTAQSAAQIKAAIDERFDASYLATEVNAAAGDSGCVRFDGTLDYAPMLFGRGMVDEVFGVALPHLRHSTYLVVDVYKPGVFF